MHNVKIVEGPWAAPVVEKPFLRVKKSCGEGVMMPACALTGGEGASVGRRGSGRSPPGSQAAVTDLVSQESP